MTHLTNNKHNLKHGFHGHKLYSVWNSMNRRCYEWTNKNYKYYGERGIKVCDEWVNDAGSFCNWALSNGWEEGLQLDRKDNDGDYTPDNCRFVTCAENNRNKRLLQENNSTGYRGVQVNSGRGKPFKASAQHDGKLIHLGYFDNAMDGAIARDKYVIKHKLGTPINFMEDTLLGRQELDALEDWLHTNHLQLLKTAKKKVIARKPYNGREKRIARIKYCINELAESINE